MAAATAASYADLAARWKYPLRQDAEYLAWRRGREPGYTPPDEPDPDAWENLSDEQRRQRLQWDRALEYARERMGGLTPERRRVYDYIDGALMADKGGAHARLRRLASKDDPDLSALAMATLDGLARLERMVRELASDGATLEMGDDPLRG